MDKFQTSVLEYLGKIENGILVLISIVYNDVYYEATYFYTIDQLVLTVPENLEDEIGHKITEDEEYPNLIKNLIKKIIPHKEMYNKIDEVDFRRWIVKD